jgi:hypothetical protein
MLMRQIANLRARGDSRGAARLVAMIQPITARINRINNRLANSMYGGAPMVGSMAPLGNVPPVANIPLGGYGAAPSSYYGNPYGAGSYYGNSAYGNPMVDTFTNAVLPMLSYIH